MSLDSVNNNFERNIFTLAGFGTDIYDYFIKEDGEIVRSDSDAFFKEFFFDLNDFFKIETQRKNLKNLMSKVFSLNVEEARYSFNNRMIMCTHVWNKFQKNTHKIQKCLQKKKYELAKKKAEIDEEAEIDDLLERLSGKNKSTKKNSQNQQLEAEFDNLSLSENSSPDLSPRSSRFNAALDIAFNNLKNLKNDNLQDKENCSESKN